MLSRRQFLKGAIAMGAAGLVADGVLLEPRHVVVERKTIAINDLPDAFDGFRICQITDVHHGPFTGLEFIKKVVEKVNSLNPGLVVLTGDYVDHSSKYIVPAVSALCRLKSSNGVLSVLGNHDHWMDANLTQEVFNRYNVPVITNSHKLIEIKDKAICVAGVGDLMEDSQDLKAAFYDAPADIPRILLSHNPDYAESMPASERVDLVLAGHTHGGQIRMPFSIAPITMSMYGQKYAGGLVRSASSQVYVSRGIGVVGLPVRFNCPPEITLRTLTA
jgi:predicted MPP superfamily phosphohydrolase